MQIIISNTSGKPIYEQIVTQIKQLILTNALQAGEALPSMRLLAKDLQISVITTKRAYETVVGKGSFVARKNENFIKEEQLRIVETHLQQAVVLAKQCGLAEEELSQLLHLLYQEDVFDE